jgi:hypothetical protein
MVTSDNYERTINQGKCYLDYPLIIYEYCGYRSSYVYNEVDILDLRYIHTTKKIYTSSPYDSSDNYRINSVFLGKNLLVCEAGKDKSLASQIEIYNVSSQQKHYQLKLNNLYIKSIDVKNDLMIISTDNKLIKYDL